ncbi:MAG: primosomal protein N' [Holosporales bacterium]|nr:primosomal protein N' [Holosporales bacterium]
MIYSIGVTKDLGDLYSYAHDGILEIGQLVVVDFRNRESVGIVMDDKGRTSFTGKVKCIAAVLPYKLPEQYLKFAIFVADYNINKIGSVLKLLVPFSIESVLSAEKGLKSHKSAGVSNVQLSKEQQASAAYILKHIGEFKVFLIHGVTGSGKTEVFLEVARHIIHGQILILVPEIALSNELAQKVAARLGLDVFIWHNSVSKSKKLAIWKKALNGDNFVVVGARSALFVPFSNLGCIVVDEEHDTSFKQDETVVYNARDMAIYLGQCLGIPVLLSSATPSVETYNNARSGKYEYVELSSRYSGAKLPAIVIDDLKEPRQSEIFSAYSIKRIREFLKLEKQILIFVNRRGHTPRVLCQSCGWRVMCPSCSSWLCYHRNSSVLMCHYCGFKTGIKIVCEKCGKSSMTGVGIGIEKALDECKKFFADARYMILSSDTANTPAKITASLDKIKNREVDIILGTQIVAKGHNFDNLSLAVIVCADAMLYGDDFRTAERARQTMCQVSGRVGRVIGQCESEVIVQTYNPDDDLVKMVTTGDPEELYKHEIESRKLMHAPPFGKFASILLSAFSLADVSNFAKNLLSVVPRATSVSVLGPVQPAIYRMRSRYRIRILVTSTGQPLQSFIKQWLSHIKIPSKIRLLVDIDPYDLS